MTSRGRRRQVSLRRAPCSQRRQAARAAPVNHRAIADGSPGDPQGLETCRSVRGTAQHALVWGTGASRSRGLAARAGHSRFGACDGNEMGGQNPSGSCPPAGTSTPEGMDGGAIRIHERVNRGHTRTGPELCPVHRQSQVHSKRDADSPLRRAPSTLFFTKPRHTAHNGHFGRLAPCRVPTLSACHSVLRMGDLQVTAAPDHATLVACGTPQAHPPFPLVGRSSRLRASPSRGWRGLRRVNPRPLHLLGPQPRAAFRTRDPRSATIIAVRA